MIWSYDMILTFIQEIPAKKIEIWWINRKKNLLFLSFFHLMVFFLFQGRTNTIRNDKNTTEIWTDVAIIFIYSHRTNNKPLSGCGRSLWEEPVGGALGVNLPSGGKLVKYHLHLGLS